MGKLRKGIDIRRVDNRNMGAGSIMRQVGIWEGFVVAIADMAKGAGSVLIAMALGVETIWVMAAGFGAILGHNYPFTVGFRGGQGVSTIMGVFFVLAPQPMLVMLAVMAITLALTRHIFSMTLLSAPLLPLLIWLFGLPVGLAYFSLLVIVYVVFRSRHRLKELRIAGTKSH